MKQTNQLLGTPMNHHWIPFTTSLRQEAEEEVASLALQRLNVGSAAAPPKALMEAGDWDDIREHHILNESQ